MTARAELLAAWQAWDRAPGNYQTATRLTTAAQAAGHELGLSTIEIRKTLAEGRRAGLTHEQVLDQLWSDT